MASKITTRRPFTTLAIASERDLVFGRAPRPVTIAEGMTLGVGETMPEVNYTLPHGAEVNEAFMPDIERRYETMARGVLQRAADLGVAKVVLEVELVFEMTEQPSWGERIAQATRSVMDEFAAEGVASALRTTVADIRDRLRPPRNRTSRETELVLETFERCAPYSDILSIESTGGKEVTDEALLMCDLGGVTFGLGVLGSRDMEFLWTRIVDICRRHGVVAGGDAACGFANTAMQLAGKGMTPHLLAAVVRAVGAARSLVALECGATGPDKDCAYEGPILKAIAGIPISMEGKSAACAHSSPIGNVAMAACDLWSNESVPFAQLFGGYTPEVSFESLWYDCKLLNEASRQGRVCELRDLLVASDAATSAEAYVLAPASCVRLARAIASCTDDAQRSLRTAREALALLDEAVRDGRTAIPEREQPFFEMLAASLDEYESAMGDLPAYYASKYPGRFLPEEYGL